MARTKAVLGSGARLSDFLSASLLARVYPAPMVQQILDEHGVNSQRVRSFPALTATYYCMALSLLSRSCIRARVLGGGAGFGVDESEAAGADTGQILDQHGP
jgi:Insertion element 4 transposase N-terminal